jgi:hypothetical protein
MAEELAVFLAFKNIRAKVFRCREIWLQSQDLCCRRLRLCFFPS